MFFDTTEPILQASAVPYRFRDGKPEFCLITSMRGNWGFPKGIIDPGETPEETALKEAEEEAGLDGEIEDDPVGRYEYRKWGTILVVTVYLMRVTAEYDHWEEARWRERRWCTADQAEGAIHRDELRKVFAAAVKRLESESA